MLNSIEAGFFLCFSCSVRIGEFKMKTSGSSDVDYDTGKIPVLQRCRVTCDYLFIWSATGSIRAPSADLGIFKYILWIEHQCF